MRFRVPSYYADFSCIAGQCTDNCCIGWEIDIDSETAEAYKQTTGAFGARLRANICFGEPSVFVLGEAERCPFLNDRNLCDIITNLGEPALCQICTDHPRYYEWFGDVKEGGVGLCCEEAARIILTQEAPFSVVETQIPDEDCDGCDTALLACLQEAREQLFAILHAESRPLTERLCTVLDHAEYLQARIDNGDLSIPGSIPVIPAEEGDLHSILAFLQTLEPISPQWHPTLHTACSHLADLKMQRERFAQAHPEVTGYLRNIAVYFIWRYYLKGAFDGEFLSRVKLAVMSAGVIGALFLSRWLQQGTLSPADCVQIAKDYSKEIEYSEENLNAVLDASYELPALSAAKLKGLFR